MNQIILLVEDNRDDQLFTLKALRHILPMQVVVVARTGTEALDYIFGTGDYEGRDPLIIPRLVLLDLMLPDLNGIEVLKRIKEDVRTRVLPVVVFTASHKQQDILDCYANGANSYICKPVDYNHYRENIKQMVVYWFALCQLPVHITPVTE